MKKVVSLLAAATVTFSLSACMARNPGNVGMDDRNNGVNNGVANQGGIAGQNMSANDFGNAGRNYKDGVYTGVGEPHDKGNERATVTVRNGRIVDIALVSLDTYGEVKDDNVADNMGNTAGNNGTNRTLDTGRNPSINDTNIGNAGAITDTGDNRALNNATEGNPNRVDAGNIGASRDINNALGNTMGQIRTNLTNAIIQGQNHDVNIGNNDANMATPINNWKLAVRRALDQAAGQQNHNNQ